MKKDLSNEVSVFVTTVGAPSYGKCMDRLHGQDCNFRLQVIDHVAPLSAAFQQILDKCETPFYVQVDEDMLLYPHAVRSLYERIIASHNKVAILSCLLYDVHLKRCIHGVKIFRHTITRQYPFNDVEGCEWDQVHRIKRDGYIYIRMPKDKATRNSPHTLGLHGTHWTSKSIYERFATFERKRCRGNKTHEWITEYPPIFLKRFLEEDSMLDFFALMGIISGKLASHKGKGREKDYRNYNKLPGFDSLCRFLDEVQSGK
jgi:hypothetical protein